jgi:hypothetical protein
MNLFFKQNISYQLEKGFPIGTISGKRLVLANFDHIAFTKK